MDGKQATRHTTKYRKTNGLCGGPAPSRRLRATRFLQLSLADLVVLARGLNPIPSRTRPLNSSAPMVLSLKAWKSRSLPGLPRTIPRTAFAPRHDVRILKAPWENPRGFFVFCVYRPGGTEMSRCPQASFQRLRAAVLKCAPSRTCGPQGVRPLLRRSVLPSRAGAGTADAPSVVAFREEP